MSQSPSIEILLATQFRSSLDFLKEIFPEDLPNNLAVLVVNQQAPVEVVSSVPQIRVINTAEKGLSRSRNMALAHAKGRYCLFTDDDVVFKPGFERQILDGFAHFPEATALQFCYESTPGKLAKPYSTSPKRGLSWGELMNVSSIELAIQRAKWQETQVVFNPHFGLGSDSFPMGEEQLFLADLKYKAAEIDFYPAALTVHPQASTAAKVDMHQRYYVAGGVFTAIFGKKAWRWIALKISYELKQKKLNLPQVRPALTAAKLGRAHYFKLKL